MNSVPVYTTRDYTTELHQARQLDAFDGKLEPEVQTDKTEGKLVPCRGCQRPLLVNRFYSAAQASCKGCGLSRALGNGDSAGPATVSAEVLAETLKSYPKCRCEELGLRAGLPVAELIELEAGCTSSHAKARFENRRVDHHDRGFVCDRLNTIRRRYGK